MKRTIINAHTHLVDLEGMLMKYGNVGLPGGIAVLHDLEPTLRLLQPNILIDQMDEAGVSKSVLFAVEAPLVYSSNEYVAAICTRFPDRFIGFASVDPRDKSAAKTLEHAVRNLGLQGLKLHPPLQQFFPNSEAVFSVYEKAIELNIPVVFHVGTTPFGSLCRLAHANPVLIDDVAVRFPALRIMLTHLGTLWHLEAFMVVEKNPNVFIDTAAYLYEIPQILTTDLITRVGADRIVFGTDYPMPYSDRAHRIKDFVDVVDCLAISDAHKRAFYYENFERFLYGTEAPAQVSIGLQELLVRARDAVL